ncbi:hypothetical protein PAECIP111891_07098 [Paenibacillus allorhizoplanae]|uniref:HtrL family protein n=1 Tax=Paenibacillus allorhizoplanae TaxID=2905648 RepID=A0ABM9CZF8_9BACL|nr:WlaTC/HtrL family glycosyltransferase [Paenibacillus allorhizoplanae]CAH1232806.1 hypothetical protein PAECIP111891_07098 [Paenibacillus allorhizoplanae]
MNEISIVTAFFNINRNEWGPYSRTVDEYLGYFSIWAKMKNKLIVYVESSELAERIISVREKYGLKEFTIVNIVDDYTKIDTELYESIKAATQNQYQKQFRLLPNNPECWNYNYNYVMQLKMWCVQDAIAKEQASGMVAWVDFGFNHGGSVIDSNSDFNFLWEYNFPEKINLFSIQDIDDRPIFDIVRSMDVYIMGTIIVGVDKLWHEFWLLMRTAMISLNNCGLTDDDQTILLMAYRINPRIFQILESGWMLQIKQYGGEHLVLKTAKNNGKKKNIKKYFINTPVRGLIRKIKDTILNLRYSIRVFSTLQKTTRK